MIIANLYVTLLLAIPSCKCDNILNIPLRIITLYNLSIKCGVYFYEENHFTGYMYITIQ